jgi:hypothetical protein
MTDCLLLAHGGSIDQTRKFDVPAGVTVAFLAPAGNTYKGAGPMGVYQKLWAAGGSVSHMQEYAQSRPCPDYILAKAMGTHWEDEHDQANYVQAHRYMTNLFNAAPGTGKNWLPHLVTVRNRKAKKQNVWLSTLISDLVNARSVAALGIKKIYCANCRDDISSEYTKFRKTVGTPKLGSRKGR